MKYLLDTNICIYLIKKKPEQVLKKLSKLDPTNLFISAVTWSELCYGAEKSLYKERNFEALNVFVMSMEILSWSRHEAEMAGKIRSELEKKGFPIGPFDNQIAAQAICAKAILVTNNEREFSRIKGLKIENWVKN